MRPMARIFAVAIAGTAGLVSPPAAAQEMRTGDRPRTGRGFYAAASFSSSDDHSPSVASPFIRARCRSAA